MLMELLVFIFAIMVHGGKFLILQLLTLPLIIVLKILLLIPPNFTVGAWVDADLTDHITISSLSGSGTTSTILPIELVAFEAKTASNSILLSWTTASEKNNIGFDIERSYDGTDFQKIAFVKGAGTTHLVQQYTYTHASVQAITYYRLKQVDTDGKFEYSKVVSVESNGDGLKVYPTLVSDGLLTVQGAQSDDFTVTNLFGQTVLIGKTSPQINVSNLAKGSYLLKIGSEVTKFLKQ
jgi:hypothetical protein